MAIIEVDQLNRMYGATTAIADLSFSVEAGEIVGFLGPNGAGKTTTMRILSGYLPATSGTAKIAGYDVHDQSMEVRQNIGYLPERLPLYPEMTVIGFLDFVAQIKGVNAGDRPRKIQIALETCQLVAQRDMVIRKLSRGFQQRVGIAQAIVHEPPVIMLDEPTIGLDPAQLIEMRNLIKSLAGDRTVLLSTHLLSEVNMTCSRVVMINQGRLVATDTPDNLREMVGGGGGYYLEVDGNPDEIKPMLAVLPNVKKVATKKLGDRRSSIEISLVNNCEPGRDIASIVLSAGLGLYELRRTKSSLEDVFLELIRDEPLPLPQTKILEKELVGDRIP